MKKAVLLALGLLSLGLVLTAMAWARDLPPLDWSRAALRPNAATYTEIAFQLSALPRLAMALLAGTMLGLAGLVFQHILRNPLAEPATLGVAAGAQLGITLILMAGADVGHGARTLAALAGASLIGGIVIGLNARHGFAPTRLILTGLVVNLAVSSIGTVLALTQFEFLRGLFVWGSGSLLQNDFAPVLRLLAETVPLAGLLMLLVRPLALADLGEAGMRALGVPVARLRLAVLGLALLLTGFVTAEVGVIGFVGLASPHLAKLAGGRRMQQQIWLAPLFGAALLVLADGLVQFLAPFSGQVPTGALTALLGAPLILLLLPRLRGEVAASHDGSRRHARRRRAGTGLVLLGAILTGALLVSFLVPAFRQPFDPWLFVEWRWPRIVAALAAGALLSLAGALMQGLTGNEMAGPEVLGVSSGAALGVVASFLLLPVLAPAAMLGFAFLGACLAFAALLLTVRGAEHAPTKLLLSGVAIGTMAAALISLVIASGDLRAVYVLAWMSGPTYRASGLTAVVALMLALLLPILALAAARPLRILPLGTAISTALGVAVPRSRLAILALAGLATAGGVLIVGPLSFVGLIAPQISRALGFGETRSHLIASALVGALVMVLADGLGRTLLFPYEIPAGILASLFGAPYFLWALRERRRS